MVHYLGFDASNDVKLRFGTERVKALHSNTADWRSKLAEDDKVEFSFQASASGGAGGESTPITAWICALITDISRTDKTVTLKYSKNDCEKSIAIAVKKRNSRLAAASKSNLHGSKNSDDRHNDRARVNNFAKNDDEEDEVASSDDDLPLSQNKTDTSTVVQKLSFEEAFESGLISCHSLISFLSFFCYYFLRFYINI